MDLCKILFHKWKLVEESLKTYRYYKCERCGKKKTVQIYSGGYSPVKEGWPKP